MSIGFIDNTCIAYKQTVFTTWDNFFGKYIKQKRKVHLFERSVNVYLICRINWRNIRLMFGCITYQVQKKNQKDIHTESPLPSNCFILFQCCIFISFIEIIYFVVVRIIGSTFLSMPKNGKPRKQQKNRGPCNARNYPNIKLYSQRY